MCSLSSYILALCGTDKTMVIVVAFFKTSSSLVDVIHIPTQPTNTTRFSQQHTRLLQPTISQQFNKSSFQNTNNNHTIPQNLTRCRSPVNHTASRQPTCAVRTPTASRATYPTPSAAAAPTPTSRPCARTTTAVRVTNRTRSVAVASRSRRRCLARTRRRVINDHTEADASSPGFSRALAEFCCLLLVLVGLVIATAVLLAASCGTCSAAAASRSRRRCSVRTRRQIIDEGKLTIPQLLMALAVLCCLYRILLGIGMMLCE